MTKTATTKPPLAKMAAPGPSGRTRKPRKSVSVQIRMDKDLAAKLERLQLAYETRTVAATIRRAIEQAERQFDLPPR